MDVPFFLEGLLKLEMEGLGEEYPISLEIKPRRAWEEPRWATFAASNEKRSVLESINNMVQCGWWILWS